MTLRELQVAATYEPLNCGGHLGCVDSEGMDVNMFVRENRSMCNHIWVTGNETDFREIYSLYTTTSYRKHQIIGLFAALITSVYMQISR